MRHRKPEVGERLIADELAMLPDGDTKDMVVKRLKASRSGSHDLFLIVAQRGLAGPVWLSPFDIDGRPHGLPT
jgi:hypothetical protein